MQGARNPYPGKIGQIGKGALADLLVVDGDPRKCLEFLENPDKNIAMIIKAGQVYKKIF